MKSGEALKLYALTLFLLRAYCARRRRCCGAPGSGQHVTRSGPGQRCPLRAAYGCRSSSAPRFQRVRRGSRSTRTVQASIATLYLPQARCCNIRSALAVFASSRYWFVGARPVSLERACATIKWIKHTPSLRIKRWMLGTVHDRFAVSNRSSCVRTPGVGALRPSAYPRVP